MGRGWLISICFKREEMKKGKKMIDLDKSKIPNHVAIIMDGSHSKSLILRKLPIRPFRKSGFTKG